MACPNCEGRGYNLINKCYKCSGKGTLGNANEIKINIPKGIDSGQFVRIRGMGDYRNGNYGDLLIQIELKSSEGFEKMGSDLVYNLYLNYEDLLKDKYSIPHPDGELIVPAPKNFDTSKPLRLRGKGYSSGDMFIKIHVKFDRPT
jgi:molecular chaperone DnaJ